MAKWLTTEEMQEIMSQNTELKKYSEKLTQANIKLQEELENTKSKLKHLEDISKFSSTVTVGSSEEELCKLEINRLYQAAQRAPLEFQQVKSFEIYVKSLMLIRGKTIDETKKSKKSDNNLTNDQLLQLALQVVDDTNEQ